jgi:hypothetical protein
LPDSQSSLDEMVYWAKEKIHVVIFRKKYEEIRDWSDLLFIYIDWNLEEEY